MPRIAPSAAALFLASTAFAQWSGPTGINNLVFYNSGNVYIGTPGFTNPNARADVVDTAQDGRVIAFHAYAGTPVSGVRTTAIWGETNNPTGRALQGFNFASTGNGAGIWAETAAISGTGLRARATSTTGSNYGVYAETASSSGTGVVGDASSTSGTVYGGYFYHRSTLGGAVVGWAQGGSGTAAGVIGITDSPTGYAGSFVGGRSWFEGNVGIGSSSISPAFPLEVTGSSSSAVGYFTNSSSAVGTTSGGPAGVKGIVTNQGIWAAGVWGIADGNNGSGIGVAGYHDGAGYGIYGRCVNVGGYAGVFAGDVSVTGTLSKGGGAFKIDHPLDPDNKYLYHSFVESPDMLNIYNGNTTTDSSGYATITLPDWFETLNTDFKYQLTIIDEADTDWTFAKVVRRIENNQFTIRTSSPNTIVSWLVTGIRKDKFAEAHRIPTEQEKEPWNKGRYLHPELYGKSQAFELQQKPADPSTAQTTAAPASAKLPFNPRRQPPPSEPALTPAIHGGR